MGQIFEFISGNIFIIILIISGIIGLLSKNKEEQKTQQQKQTQERRTTASKPESTPRPSGPLETQHSQTYESRKRPIGGGAISVGSIADKQQEKKFGVTSTDLRAAEISQHGLPLDQEPMKVLTEEEKELKNGIRRGLNNKGLINGIIMAEILAKPRSLKPFESVTLERYKK